ncbi:hypothetical protein ACP70R_000889 [Stipagrostis hirtigluma subsp. patula]
MALLPIKPLDGADGYLRWKESVLLRLHTVGVAHVLSQDPPSGDGDGAAAAAEAAEKWARDDAVCRGHILAALSDRLLPDYARHATGRAVWDAVARTYDLDTSSVSWQRFNRFRFDGGAPFLEQLAHAEALGAAGKPFSSDVVAYTLCHEKLPGDVAIPLMVTSRDGSVNMDSVWGFSRAKEVSRIRMEDELQGKAAMVEDQEEGRVCWTCGKSGHIARNCRN